MSDPAGSTTVLRIRIKRTTTDSALYPFVTNFFTRSPCGGMSFLLIATTYFDNVVSILVLASLRELLKLRESEQNGSRRASLTHGARAGLFIGAASAFKLTVMPFAVGIVAAAWAMRSGARSKAVLVASLAAAALASFLVIGGPWMLHLWHATDNPLFPYFNNLFGSPLLASDSYQANFVPQSAWRALEFPFLFVADPQRTSDALFADYKVLIVYCVLLLSVPLMWLWRSAERPFTDEDAFRSARLIKVSIRLPCVTSDVRLRL